jgi:hypothetical protein
MRHVILDTDIGTDVDDLSGFLAKHGNYAKERPLSTAILCFKPKRLLLSYIVR